MSLGLTIGLSRTQVHRKLKALTGQAPGDYIRSTRLHRARALLRAQVGTVAEVSYQVGFGSPAAFSTAFSRQFGYPPSATTRQNQRNRPGAARSPLQAREIDQKSAVPAQAGKRLARLPAFLCEFRWDDFGVMAQK